MDNLEKIYNETFAYDEEVKDIRDIEFEELAGWSIDLPKRVLLSDWQIVNQKATLLCVAFGTTNWVNESLNFYWYKPDKEPNILAWYIRKYLDPLIDKRWTYIVNWPKWARKLGWIEWYSQINTLDWIKQSIFLWLPIATWTNKLSWSKTRKNAVAVIWKGGGHFVSIVWYDDEMEREDWFWKKYKWFLIVENTWWEKWWEKWRYYIPYKIAFDVLFNTKKNLIPNKEKARKHLDEIIEKLNKKKKEIKVKPAVVKKYEYYAEDIEAITDEENKNLFIVMQRILKETGYKPLYSTVVWSNEDRTNARLLDVIYWARQYENFKKLK